MGSLIRTPITPLPLYYTEHGLPVCPRPGPLWPRQSPNPPPAAGGAALCTPGRPHGRVRQTTRPQRRTCAPTRPRHIFAGGGAGCLGPPLLPGSLPGPKIFKRKSSWHRRRRRKILAVSLKHWKGRTGGGEGGQGGGVKPPSTVHGRSTTPLRQTSALAVRPIPQATAAGGLTVGVQGPRGAQRNQNRRGRTALALHIRQTSAPADHPPRAPLHDHLQSAGAHRRLQRYTPRGPRGRGRRWAPRRMAPALPVSSCAGAAGGTAASTCTRSPPLTAWSASGTTDPHARSACHASTVPLTTLAAPFGAKAPLAAPAFRTGRFLGCGDPNSRSPAGTAAVRVPDMDRGRCRGAGPAAVATERQPAPVAPAGQHTPPAPPPPHQTSGPTPGPSTQLMDTPAHVGPSLSCGMLCRRRACLWGRIQGWI